MLKRMKAHKYQSNVQAKAAYLASRPKDSTYKVDETEEVFANPVPAEGEGEGGEKRVVAKPLKQRKRKTTAERKKAKKAKTAGLAAVGRAKDGGGSGGDDD